MQAEDNMGLTLMRGKQTPGAGGLEMETGDWRVVMRRSRLLHIVGSAVSSGGREKGNDIYSNFYNNFL